MHPGCKLSVADYGALLKNVEMDLMRCLAELLHSATATAIFFLGRSRLKCLPLRKCSGSTEQDVFLAYNMTMCLIVYRWRERERAVVFYTETERSEFKCVNVLILATSC